MWLVKVRHLPRGGLMDEHGVNAVMMVPAGRASRGILFVCFCPVWIVCQGLFVLRCVRGRALHGCGVHAVMTVPAGGAP